MAYYQAAIFDIGPYGNGTSEMYPTVTIVCRRPSKYHRGTALPHTGIEGWQGIFRC